MKRIVFSILSGCFFLLLICNACNPLKSGNEKGSSVKIMTYNVRNCRGMDNITDYKRVANVITRVAPDVAALQELDSATQRSNGIVALSELASYTDMYQTYGASIAYQGGKYGIGILTREKPLNSELIALPGREERRSLLIVELKKYVICCTHFSLTEEDRFASVNIINNAVKKFSKPVFLAGDFNALPESPVIVSVEKNWDILNNPEKPTIPSNNPQRCIDYIFAADSDGHHFETLQTAVEQEPVASDHLPVWVVVKFK